MKKTILLAIVFFGVLIFSVGYSDSKYRTAIGRTVPDISLPSGDSIVRLSDLRGGYVLLNFWKSNDAPSRKRANDYTAWLRRHRTGDIRLVSVNLDESSELYGEIMRRDSLIPSTQYHVGGDTARAVYDTFGLSDGFGTMLVDPEGKIVVHNPSWDQLSVIQDRRRSRQ